MVVGAGAARPARKGWGGGDDDRLGGGVGAGARRKKVEEGRRKKMEVIRWGQMGESEPSISDPMAQKFE